MKQLIIYIRDGRILNSKRVRELFDSLKDGKHFISIKDYRNRSLQQNAYYWSCVVPMVRQGLYESGYDDVRTNEEAHEVLKHLFLSKKLTNYQTGETIEIAGSSRKLKVSEFAEYLERIYKWAAEYLNIVIPNPNEQWNSYQ